MYDMQSIYPQTFANGLPASLWAIWTSAAPLVFRSLVGVTVFAPTDAHGVDVGLGVTVVDPIDALGVAFGMGVTLDDASASENLFGVDPDRGVEVA
jgi:hypothetical protein